MAALHEAHFRWPHTDAADVIVTGSFDGWSRSTHLTKTPTGFEATARVPWGEKVTYKYIVDGRWSTTDDQPTELDTIGNLNNIYIAPPRPAASEPSPTPAPAAPETTTESTSPSQTVASTVVELATTAKDTAVAMVEAIAPGTTATPSSLPSPPQPSPNPAPVPEIVVSTPAPEPEPPTPDPNALTAEAVLAPAETAAPHFAPRVPMHILPLGYERPDTAPVHGASTTATATTTSEDANAEEAQEPSTHTPAGMNGVDHTQRGGTPKPNVNGSGSGSGSGLAPITAKETGKEENGTKPDETGRTIPTPTTPAVILNGTTEVPISPAVNGIAPSTPAPTSTPASVPTNGTPSTPSTNGTSPAPKTPHTPPTTPPAKDKRMMRFPSLSARSLHSRRSSSSANTSVSELGDGGGESGHDHEKKGKGSGGLETLAGRVGGVGKREKRTSLFGKLRDMFESPGKQT